MTEFYDITTDLKNALIASPFVNTVTTGGLEDVDLNKKTIFPLSHIIVNSAVPKSQTVSFNISIIAMDIVDESKETTTDIFVGNDNEQDVLNTQFQVLNRLYQQMLHGQLFSDLIQIIGDPNCEPFTDRFENKLAGWTMTFDVEIPNEMTICGNSIPPSCADAFIQNSDGSFSADVASGSSLVLEDVRIRVFDQDGNSLAGDDYPSNIDVDITVEVTNEVNAEAINTLNEIVTTAVLTPTNNQILAPDAHLRIKKSGGTDIVEIDLPSGSDEVQIISDSVITLKDSSGTTISTTNVQATETANITAPDGLININGSSVGNVKSNGLRNLFVKLNGTNSGTYDGVDTINVTSTDAWVRPTGWLPLDTVGTGTNKFSGLFAVYETQKNVCTIQITIGSHAINWGDGTTQVTSSNVIYTKVYDYATISSAVLVDEFGFNYKMVVVNISLATATALYIDRNTTATLINNGRTLGWLDIALDCSTMTAFITSGQGKPAYLERMLVYNMASNVNGCDFSNMQVLKVLKFPFANVSNGASMFASFIGQVRDESNNPININMTSATGNNQNLFNNSLIDHVGNISAPTITNASQWFNSNFNLQSIGTVNFPLVTTLSLFIYLNYNLTKMGTITTSSTLTSLNNFGNGCRKLKGINITNCSGVTDVTSAFVGMVSLENLILTGLTRGFTIDDCNMSATAIDALFTSLGTASGSQTINVRRNPGSATCTTSIATSKGYTVVIA